jgi:hypothetical protein
LPPGVGLGFTGSGQPPFTPHLRPLLKRCERVTGSLRPSGSSIFIGKRGKRGHYEDPAHEAPGLGAARGGARLPDRLGDDRRRLVVPRRPPHRDGAGRRGGLVGLMAASPASREVVDGEQSRHDRDHEQNGQQRERQPLPLEEPPPRSPRLIAPARSSLLLEFGPQRFGALLLPAQLLPQGDFLYLRSLQAALQALELLQ